MISARQFMILFVLSLVSSCLFPQNSIAADNNSANSANNLAGINPHAISLYNLGLSAYKQGSPESAIIFFKRAVDLDPILLTLSTIWVSSIKVKDA